MDVIGESSNSMIDQEEDKITYEQQSSWEESIVGH